MQDFSKVRPKRSLCIFCSLGQVIFYWASIFWAKMEFCYFHTPATLEAIFEKGNTFRYVLISLQDNPFQIGDYL